MYNVGDCVQFSYDCMAHVGVVINAKPFDVVVSVADSAEVSVVVVPNEKILDFLGNYFDDETFQKAWRRMLVTQEFGS